VETTPCHRQLSLIELQHAEHHLQPASILRQHEGGDASVAAARDVAYGGEFAEQSDRGELIALHGCMQGVTA
jgi:hypothetical protein